MQYITLIAGILEQVLGLVGTVTKGQVANVISILEKIIPVAVQEAQDLLAPIQNIISALEGSGAVTTEQLQSLTAMSVQVDEALDAAAKDDNLTGV